MKIVVDTNVFINAIGTTSPYRWMLDKIISGEFTLCLSNDIFFEYWEVLESKTSQTVANNIANFLAVIPSVKLVNPYIKWDLMTNDPDDNKFVDCALNTGAECIITHDTHFNLLKEIPFPKLSVLTPEEFQKIYSPGMK